MIALTVWQPWASLIAYGWKPYEFRQWRAPQAHVGKRIAIHAGVRKPERDKIAELAAKLVSSDCADTGVSPDAFEALNSWANNLKLLPRGFIVATATLGTPIRNEELAAAMGVEWVRDSDREKHTNWGWPMNAVRRCEPPVQATGKQGIWTWNGELP